MELFYNMTPADIFLINFGVLCSFYFLGALFSLIKKRADFADIAWGIGFFLITCTTFVLSSPTFTNTLVTLLISMWAARLVCHLLMKRHKRDEDFRYQNMQKNHPHSFFSYLLFKVYGLQALLLFIVATPLIWLQVHSSLVSSNMLRFILPFWIYGFIMELVSDYQLLKFKKDPRKSGKILQTGFWGYSRHPNYLGELLQWWSIWFLCLTTPYGIAFIVSPLLLTFLIVRVSGVAPIEEKLNQHQDFPEYAKKTPMLAPFSFFNGLIFWFLWLFIVQDIAHTSEITQILVFLLVYAGQFALFAKYDRKSLLLAFPLSCYALIFGIVQETALIKTGTLHYLHSSLLIPIWLLSLYPLFALTLNSALSFLNRSFFICFLLGGIGGILSYFSGEKMQAVEVTGSYFTIFVTWGLFLMLTVSLNRKLIQLFTRYTDQEKLSTTLTAVFDKSCPICSREMCHLKKRKQTGHLIFTTPADDEELKQITKQFSFKESMQKLHAIDANGKVTQGVDALSEIYARTDLPFLAILLQAPLFYSCFKIFYTIWAKLRIMILKTTVGFAKMCEP
jgi:steroid 5-alpha reductase family enzyme/predicted DCC family thiol-disulfide oxidoreductase YuxK